MGDARLTMEKQEPQNYDVLVVDAFSSDAIPVHLLTREVMQLYFKLLKRMEFWRCISRIVIWIWRRFASEGGVRRQEATVVSDDASDNTFANSTTWVLITSQDNNVFQSSTFEGANMYPASAAATFRGWTDDYSSILPIP